MDKKMKKTLFFLSVFIPIIILLSMTFLPIMAYLFGDEIQLETKAIDPRTLFRGDYIALNLKISDVPMALFPKELKDNSFNNQKVKEVFAELKKQGDYYVVDKITFNRPANSLYLSAKVYGYQFNRSYTNTVQVQFPIDRYFVPENTGKELEDLTIKGDLVAIVKVWHGYPLLVNVVPKE